MIAQNDTFFGTDQWYEHMFALSPIVLNLFGQDSGERHQKMIENVFSSMTTFSHLYRF